MKLYHVVAVSKNRVIGKDNKLPWHFSSDLKHFKSLTTSQTVIMGRKTFESIGKALPNRQNFVLSRSNHPDQAAVRFFSSFEKAVKQVKTPKAFVIGGGELYQTTLDKMDGIFLTLIDQEFEGDTYYPELSGEFSEQSREKLQEDPKIEVIYYENTKKKVLDRV